MRWTLLALCALLAGCGSIGDAPANAPTLRVEAPPKQVELGWVERYGEGERHLRFEVASFEVTRVGWSARIAIENRTGGVFELGARPLALAFGLMLFADGRLDTLEELNAAGALPAIRRAAEIEPAPPEALAPAERWESTIGARGSLPQGAWVRVCFGTLFAVGEPPPGLESRIVWITDRAHRL